MKIDPATFTVSTFAGTAKIIGLVDGPLLPTNPTALTGGAKFARPSRLAESPVDHSLWIADQFNNAVRRIAMDKSDPNFGMVQTIAGSGNAFRGINCGPKTSILTTGASPNATCDTSITVPASVVGSPTAIPANNPVLMNNPVAVIVDHNNVVYVSEAGNSIIRRITPQGPITNRSYVVDILAGDFTDTSVTDTTVTPNVTTTVRTVRPGFADGIAVPVANSTATVAQFDSPDGLALGIDADGDDVLYVADSLNFRIRRIFLSGPNINTVDTIAGSFLGNADGDRFTGTFDQVASLELLPDGITLIVTDPISQTVRKVNALTGDVSTIGTLGTFNLDGGPGSGGFAAPTGTALTADGKLLVADSGPVNASKVNNNAIRWLQNDGSIVTLAGQDSVTGGFADGSQFTAQFKGPRSLYVASDGTIYVCDTTNNVIRIISQPTPKSFKVRPLLRPRVVKPERRGN